MANWDSKFNKEFDRVTAEKKTSDYIPPAGHTKHLSDSERAHSGEPGSTVKHGASATQYRYGVDKKGRELNTDVKGWAPGTDKWRE